MEIAQKAFQLFRDREKRRDFASGAIGVAVIIHKNSELFSLKCRKPGAFAGEGEKCSGFFMYNMVKLPLEIFWTCPEIGSRREVLVIREGESS